MLIVIIRFHDELGGHLASLRSSQLFQLFLCDWELNVDFLVICVTLQPGGIRMISVTSEVFDVTDGVCVPMRTCFILDE